MPSRNTHIDNTFETYQQNSRLAYDLSHRLDSMLKSGADEKTIIDLLQKKPDGVLHHSYKFTALIFAGMPAAFDYVLSREDMSAIDPTRRQEYARSTYNNILSAISGNYSRAFDHRKTEAELDALKQHALKGIDLILAYANKEGIDAKSVIPLDLFSAHHNFDLIPDLVARGADLDGTLTHKQNMFIWGGYQRASGLHALECYAIASNDGKTPITLKHEFNYQSLRNMSESYVMPLIDALRQNDPATARDIITKADIRLTQSFSIASEVIAYADGLLPLLLSQTRVANKSGLASHMIEEIITRFIIPKDSEYYNPAHDTAALRALDTLIATGGDINTGSAKLLIIAAQNNRMDLAPKLVKRGADVRTALEGAKNYWQSDNEQGVGAYLSYPHAIKNLQALIDASPKKRNGPKPA